MTTAFDFQQITEELGMDSEDVTQLMVIYRTEFQLDFQMLETAAHGFDWPLLKSRLHKMKGDAANMCLHLISDTFADMESTVTVRNPAALVAQLYDARALEKQFTKALENYLSQNSEV